MYTWKMLSIVHIFKIYNPHVVHWSYSNSCKSDDYTHARRTSSYKSWNALHTRQSWQWNSTAFIRVRNTLCVFMMSFPLTCACLCVYVLVIHSIPCYIYIYISASPNVMWWLFVVNKHSRLVDSEYLIFEPTSQSQTIYRTTEIRSITNNW